MKKRMGLMEAQLVQFPLVHGGMDEEGPQWAGIVTSPPGGGYVVWIKMPVPHAEL